MPANLPSSYQPPVTAAEVTAGAAVYVPVEVAGKIRHMTAAELATLAQGAALSFEPQGDGSVDLVISDPKTGVETGRTTVSGLGAYDAWLAQPGNEGGTFDDFLDAITGAALTVAGAALDGDGNTVVTMSDGATFTVLRGPAGPAVAAPLALASPAAGTVPLAVQGAAGQAAHLQEWRDSAGGLLAYLGATGAFEAPLLQTRRVVDPTHFFYSLQSEATYTQVGDNDHPLYAVRAGVGQVPSGTTLAVKNFAPSERAVEVTAAVGQTADLQAWRDSVGNRLGGVRAGGQPDFVTGYGTGAQGETNSLMVRATAADGNTQALLLGLGSAGGATGTYSYVQATYWGGDVKALALNPLGGGVVVGANRATAALDVGGDGSVRLRAPSNAGGSQMGRLLFGPTGDVYAGNMAFIAATSEANWYQGAHLDFHTDFGPDQAQAQAPRRMRLSSRGHLLIGTAADNALAVLQANGDVEVVDAARGLVLTDRTLGTRHRVALDNGALTIEAA